MKIKVELEQHGEKCFVTVSAPEHEERIYIGSAQDGQEALRRLLGGVLESFTLGDVPVSSILINRDMEAELVGAN